MSLLRFDSDVSFCVNIEPSFSSDRRIIDNIPFQLHMQTYIHSGADNIFFLQRRGEMFKGRKSFEKREVKF